VLDADSQTVQWEATVGAAPHGVVVSRTLGRAYVVLGGSNSLAILDWPPEPLRAR
jgi:DNA-binding beta-propeller fold protein YncE